MVPTASDAQGWKDLFGDVPEVQVRVTHPPRLGDQIQDINKVAFANAQGECAGEFVDSLIADFVGNGVQVIDRSHVDDLLDEHELTASGLVDRTTAQELGSILGPSALIFVNVRRCATQKQALTNHRKGLASRKVYYEFISRTTAHFKASIQVVDLSTARIYSARALDESVSRNNNSPSGQPEYPDPFEVTDQAIAQAVARVHEMFFPWTESRTLRFYDNKDCNLELAYSLVKAEDIPAAIEQSLANASACESYTQKKPKLVARAYYNLGMAYCLGDEFDQGLEYLDRSLRLHPHDLTSTAVAECRRASNAMESMEQFAEDTGQGGSDQPTSESVDSQLSELRNLYREGLLPEDMYKTRIEELIRENGPPGDTTEDRLRSLKRLRDDGLITRGVYEEEVSRVLGDV